MFDFTVYEIFRISFIFGIGSACGGFIFAICSCTLQKILAWITQKAENHFDECPYCGCLHKGGHAEKCPRCGKY